MKFLLDEDALSRGVVPRSAPKVLIGLSNEILKRGGLCLNLMKEQVYLIQLAQS